MPQPSRPLPDPSSPADSRLKRALDLALAAFLCAMLAPVMLAIVMALYVSGLRPPVFRQRRVGRGRHEFTLFKFRTMTEARSADGRLLSDTERLTPLGRLLRKTSLDELPQLWNVLRGDLSFVGPRPLLPHYLPYYTDREQTRHNVRPGITGWAQVNGRNQLSWDGRLERDVWYVENWSPGLDARILARTILMVFRGSGVVVDPKAALLDFDTERMQRQAVPVHPETYREGA